MNMHVTTTRLILALTRGTRLTFLGLGLLAISLATALPIAAQAAITVTNWTDTPAVNLCSLREAIQAANTNAAVGGCQTGTLGPDTIILPGGVYTLSIQGAGEDANLSGDLDITEDLTITGAGANLTFIDGAGIDRVLHIHAGTIILNDITIMGGLAATGGGIRNEGTLTLNRSTVSYNIATAQIGSVSGAGIFNLGKATLDSSTVSYNIAAGAGAGGGITVYQGTLILRNSTVSRNGAQYGGGIVTSNYPIVVELSNSTVSENSGTGGGVRTGQYTDITFKNTIVARNFGSNCDFNFLAFPLPGATVVTNLGVNMSNDTTCNFTGALNNVSNAGLGPLQGNGGPTDTHALLALSPAIDAVLDCTDIDGNPIASDQRGVDRPQGPLCDVGAYEFGCAPPPSGMVAWWPLDEIAGTIVTDINGLHPGTPAPGPIGPINPANGPAPGNLSPIAPPAAVGGSLYFYTQANRFVRVPDAPDLNIGTGDFTIDAWVHPVQVGADLIQPIVDKLDVATNLGYSLHIRSPGISNNAQLEFIWGNGNFLLPFQSFGLIAYDTWQHVAVTFRRLQQIAPGDPSFEAKLYLNGVLFGQQSGGPPGGVGNIANTLDLLIGGTRVNAPAGLGAIALDELEIFNVALSLSDIQSIYNAGSAGKCKCSTGGQSVDLTVANAAGVFGVGNGVPATVSNPVTVSYSALGCTGQEMFLVAQGPWFSLQYLNATGTWLPVPAPPALITPWLIGGPPGTSALFSGLLPVGTYDLYLICDTIVNGHLDVALGPPLCLNGAFDYLRLTVP